MATSCLLGRRRFLEAEDDFSILETKEECLMVCLSRLVVGMDEEAGVGRDALLSGSWGFVVLVRIDVRFLPVVGA